MRLIIKIRRIWISPSPDWNIEARTCAAGRSSRAYLPGCTCWRRRRISGYVAPIGETTGEDTDFDAYRFDVVANPHYIADVHPGRSGGGDSLRWLWVGDEVLRSERTFSPKHGHPVGRLCSRFGFGVLQRIESRDLRGLVVSGMG